MSWPRGFDVDHRHALALAPVAATGDAAFDAAGKDYDRRMCMDGRAGQGATNDRGDCSIVSALNCRRYGRPSICGGGSVWLVLDGRDTARPQRGHGAVAARLGGRRTSCCDGGGSLWLKSLLLNWQLPARIPSQTDPTSHFA